MVRSLADRIFQLRLYPHADALARYLEDFSAALAKFIRFNTTVEALRRDPADPAGFVVRLSAGGPVRCARVIMASGWRPRPHTVPGLFYRFITIQS